MKRDKANIAQLLNLRAEDPGNQYYGVIRLALALDWSINKTRRIRQLSGVATVPYKITRTRQSSPASEIAIQPNLLKSFRQFRNNDRPQDGQTYQTMAIESGAWVQDFTHVRCGAVWYYLAVVLKLSSRQVLGWSLGASHDISLTLSALNNALTNNNAPPILHSDQGSEYLSYQHQDLCTSKSIALSCSDAHSPWQNGFMESFFGKFKPEMGSPKFYNQPETLFEVISQKINYYNTKRIHTALGMSPLAYALQLKQKESIDSVLQIKGA